MAYTKKDLEERISYDQAFIKRFFEKYPYPEVENPFNAKEAIEEVKKCSQSIIDIMEKQKTYVAEKPINLLTGTTIYCKDATGVKLTKGKRYKVISCHNRLIPKGSKGRRWKEWQQLVTILNDDNWTTTVNAKRFDVPINNNKGEIHRVAFGKPNIPKGELSKAALKRLEQIVRNPMDPKKISFGMPDFPPGGFVEKKHGWNARHDLTSIDQSQIIEDKKSDHEFVLNMPSIESKTNIQIEFLNLLYAKKHFHNMKHESLLKERKDISPVSGDWFHVSLATKRIADVEEIIKDLDTIISKYISLHA